MSDYSGSWKYVQMRRSIEALEKEVATLKQEIVQIKRAIGPSTTRYGFAPDTSEPIFGPGHSQHATPVEEVKRRAGSLLKRIRKVENG